MNGRFVTFEGIEGAGKSTVIAAVAASLRAAGRSVTVTFEPGDSPLGAAVRRLLLHDAEPVDRAELFLVLADRAEHVDRVIRPALHRGEIVLCDRYGDSTVAYQADGRGLDHEFVALACRFAGRLTADRTILLDLPVEEGLRRAAASRGRLDRLEAADRAFHERVRAGFLRIAAAEPRRVRVIDATAAADRVGAAVLGALADLW